MNDVKSLVWIMTLLGQCLAFGIMLWRQIEGISNYVMTSIICVSYNDMTPNHLCYGCNYDMKRLVLVVISWHQITGLSNGVKSKVLVIIWHGIKARVLVLTSWRQTSTSKWESHAKSCEIFVVNNRRGGMFYLLSPIKILVNI